ncbi:MAG: CHAT domain-containing tetratricopeptide repeat protein, partial [Bacteroidota bacterium]
KSALLMLDKMEGDNSDIASVFQHNLGEVYRRLGNYEEAVKALTSSLNFLKEAYGEDAPPVAEDLSSLGRVYLDDARYQNAEKSINEALKIMEENEATDEIVYYNLLSTLASVYQNNAQVNRSITMRKKAIEGYREILGDESFEYAYELHELGEAYQKLEDFDNAEKNLMKGMRIRRNSLGRYHPYYSISTKQMAILRWKQNELKKAGDYFEETFENYFKQIDAYFPALSEEEKARFYNQNLKVSFEQFNSFAVANLENNPELTAKMYNYQLSTKGLIMYATAKVREAIFNSEDEELIGMYEEWVSQKEQLSKLFSGNDQNLEVRNAKIDKLITSSNELEKELSQRSADFAQTFAKSEYTWKDVQKKLKQNEAAIEIIRFRDFTPDAGGTFTDQINYAALIVKKDTENYPELVLLTNGDKMETRFLANYRNAIRYKVNENYSYKLFWKPIAEKLANVQKVYFSPDGVYNQISIYTLRNPETKKFLLDELNLQLITNTKDLIAFEVDENAGFNEQKAYLFGFPNYNMGIVENNNNDPEKIQQVAQSIAASASQGRGRGVGRGGRSTGNGGGTRSGGLSRGVRGNLQRYVSNNALLALLPGTETEVNNIQQLYASNSLQTEVYQKNQALEEAVKEVEKPQTLHIATHGFFLENQEPKKDEVVDKYVENPLLRSGLIFAGANSFLSAGSIDEEGNFEEDGILTAYEAMNMDLSETKLVVLSACETGLGEVTNGEGVYGLQRAFQIAGAESIIMSMWTVDDNATQELMNTFYEEWIKSGDKQQAFNTAQKKIKDKWKSPYYWGAFVMVGL